MSDFEYPTPNIWIWLSESDIQTLHNDNVRWTTHAHSNRATQAKVFFPGFGFSKISILDISYVLQVLGIAQI